MLGGDDTRVGLALRDVHYSIAVIIGKHFLSTVFTLHQAP